MEPQPGSPYGVGPFGWLIAGSFRALFPALNDLPGLDEVELNRFIARVKVESPAAIWWALGGASLLFVVSPLFTTGVPLPSFWLRPAALDRHAHRVASSPIYLVRQAIFLLKMFAGMCWAADPSVREQLAQPQVEHERKGWRSS
ncbi:MAG: hypothetical protein ACI9MC_001453 [Kiritimatiellia bacterium]|jgi:hypothetical protein